MLAFIISAVALCAAHGSATPTPWPVVRLQIQNVMNQAVSEASRALNDTMMQATFINQEMDPIQAVAGWSEWGVRKALPNDTTLIGSATKSITAAAIMKLVEQGQLGLDEKVAPIVDPHFATVNMSLLKYMNNDARVENITVRHLLAMTSGIPDFDTPQLREWQWANPQTTNTPLMIMASINASLYFDPGQFGAYSSTNYVLLGLILMVKAGETSWDQYDQGSILPRRPGVEYKYTEFCLEGTLSSHNSPTMNVSHGYGPTWRDWYNVSATSGWACGNGLTNSFDLAMFYWDLFNYNVVSEEAVRQMTVMTPLYTFPIYYGLGLMTMIPDPSHTIGTGMAHGGDTYGFFTMPAFNMRYNFSVVVASNYEHQGSGTSAFGTIYVAAATILKQNGYYY
eukprot:TRINITY_DN2034_c0_g1_i1.p1 TRINITY_DN2034_c0_g1~~TRINITY_DN2034_c0_g1_i1.p1  ORF type:complete len:396 (+),score=107.26 TRINITY_DN2034_c0_g1_i1:751-1938(+)